MLVTLFGMVILVKLVQPANASLPMLVTLFGMVIKLVQPANAASPMDVTLPSVGITLFLYPTINFLLAVSIIQFPALWYFRLPLATVILFKLAQRLNAPSPMLVTLFGMVILVRLVHSLNA